MKSKWIITFIALVLIFVACKNEPVEEELIIFKGKYSGKFTFTTITNSFVLTSATSRDTTIYVGSIIHNSSNLITVQYKENKSVTFTFIADGTFVSEGDFYYNGGKEGHFIGLDSVTFHIKSPGQRSGSNDWVEGKRTN